MEKRKREREWRMKVKGRGREGKNGAGGSESEVGRDEGKKAAKKEEKGEGECEELRDRIFFIF